VAGRLLAVIHTLRDGKRVRVRPIAPEDKERLLAGVARLSMRSRYLRFLAPVPTLSEAMLRHLTEIDHVNHIAWLATDPDAPGEPALGVARCLRSAEDPTVAEVAVAVADDFQSRGLGALLLETLARSAAEQGIATFRANVLRENDRVVHALAELGARGELEAGVLHVAMSVADVEAAARALRPPS
jgi:GNAT superfamily N-acetyltransferase